jgi:hypothetical protein
MKYILSWWSKPLLSAPQEKNPYDELTPKQKIEIQTYFYIKNFNFIQKNISKNIEIVTDDFGYEKLKHLTPQIRTDLNNINYFHNDLWSIGKIYALSLYDEPICMMDNDLFIKNYIKYKEIINLNWDILVQSKEISPAFSFSYERGIEVFLSLFNKELLSENLIEIYYYKTYNFAYNCGNLGFKDYKLKNQFLEKVMKIYHILNDNEKIVNFYNTCNFFNRRHEHLFTLNINCIIEQVFLTLWANYNNLYVKELMPVKEWEIFNGINNKLNNIQNSCDLYSHYIGYENKLKFNEQDFIKK